MVSIMLGKSAVGELKHCLSCMTPLIVENGKYTWLSGQVLQKNTRPSDLHTHSTGRKENQIKVEISNQGM